MTQRHTRREGPLGQRGFTLLELVTALFVLTVGLLGVITMYHFGIGKLRYLNENAVALRAVQNEIEALRAKSFEAVEPVAGGSFISETPEARRLTGARASVTIADYPDAEGELKEITARLTWRGDQGRQITKTATTLIANTGPAPQGGRP